jgi:hypothetical protein
MAPPVAEHFTPSVVIEADALWAYVVRGFVEPWKEGADDQNTALVRALLAAGARLAGAGYATVLSGHVGPRFLELAHDRVHAPVGSGRVRRSASRSGHLFSELR